MYHLSLQPNANKLLQGSYIPKAWIYSATFLYSLSFQGRLRNVVFIMGDHELSLKCYYFRRKERQLLRNNYQALPHSSLQPYHNDWHTQSWHTTNILFLKSTQLKKIRHLPTVSCLKFTFLCFKIPSQASPILLFKSYFLIFKGQLSVLHQSTGLVTQLPEFKSQLAT